MAYTGLGRTTLWKASSSGKIVTASVGRAKRLRRASLDEFMSSQTDES